jgi:NAD(P)-dependent dehydrogenase (short-subunit alcohol dehydrogenase family)
MLRSSASTSGIGHREEERVRLRSLLPSPAAPEAVADVIGFLLGPDAGHITGAVLPVDGGWTAG